VVEVQNDNWSRVTIHHVDGFLIGRVNGHSSESFEVCQLTHRKPYVNVRAIANAFSFRMGYDTMEMAPNGIAWIYIGPTPNLSYVIGP
jgi:hypothetical protein